MFAHPLVRGVDVILWRWRVEGQCLFQLMIWLKCPMQRKLLVHIEFAKKGSHRLCLWQLFPQVDWFFCAFPFVPWMSLYSVASHETGLQGGDMLV